MKATPHFPIIRGVLLLVLALSLSACNSGWWNGFIHSGGHGALKQGKP